MNKAQQKVLQRIQADPEKFLDDARNGMLPQLRQVADLWHLVPQITALSPIKTFSKHLNPAQVPFLSNDMSEAEQKEMERAKMALIGICNAQTLLASHASVVDQCAMAWPGIFKWSLFLYDTQVAGSRSSLSFEWATVDAIASAWYSLGRDRKLLRLIVSTPGAVELATRLWLLENFDSQPSAIANINGGSAALITCLGDLEVIPSVLAKVLDAADSDATEISQLALSRLHGAVAAKKVIGLKAYYLVDVINRLSAAATPLRQAFLDANSVQKLTKAFCRISTQLCRTRDVTLSYPAITCLGYLSNSIECDDGIIAVTLSIQAGLLGAIVDCSPYLSDPHLFLAAKTQIVEFIGDVLPRYLTYRSVIEAVASALEQPINEHKVLASIARQAWLDFRVLAAERSELTKLAPPNQILCDVMGCLPQKNPNSKYMKCAGCLTATYCSKECQIKDWKEGHRSICKTARQEHLEGKNPNSMLHKRDRAFHYFLNNQDAHKNRPLLIEMASRDFPDTSPTELIILIDYMVVPPTYTLKTLDQYALWNFSATLHGEAMNDSFLEKFKADPDFGLIESSISRGKYGMSVMSSFTKARAFWGIT